MIRQDGSPPRAPELSSSGSGDRLRRLDVRRALFRESALLFAPTDASADLVGRGGSPGRSWTGICGLRCRSFVFRASRHFPLGRGGADPERLRAPPAERDLHGSALHDPTARSRVERALGPAHRRHAGAVSCRTLLREVPSRRRDGSRVPRRAPPHVRLLHALSRRGVARFGAWKPQLAQAQLQALRMQLHALPLQHVERDLRAHARGRVDAAERMLARLGFLRLTLETGGAHECRCRQELEFLKALSGDRAGALRGSVVVVSVDVEHPRPWMRGCANSSLQPARSENAIPPRHRVLGVGGTREIAAHRLNRCAAAVAMVSDDWTRADGRAPQPLRERGGSHEHAGRASRSSTALPHRL